MKKAVLVILIIMIFFIKIGHPISCSDCYKDSICTCYTNCSKGWIRIKLPNNFEFVKYFENGSVSLSAENVTGDVHGIISCLDNGNEIPITIQIKEKVSPNEKLESMYTTKQAFLVSDENWRDVLPFVPVAVWTGNETWCQRGYGTPSNVCVYPLLIYHREGEAFDADSIIYFFQQYKPDKLILIGEAPEELENLLVADPELGAGFEESRINIISPDNYLSFWKSFDKVVYVEDDYEKALLASTYASLINAPLIIEGTNTDKDEIFQGKYIICVGHVNRNCDETYTIDELQKKYIELTNTDKIILINPNDWNIKVNEEFTPEKSSLSIHDLYSRTSLAAPILASAKHEVILSTKSTDYVDVDNFVEDNVKEMFNLPKEEPKIDLTDYLEQETFEFFVPKNENGLEITFNITEDFDRDKFNNIWVMNILVDKKCLGKGNISITHGANKKEIKIRFGEFTFETPYADIPVRIPSSWVPQKGNNFTLAVTTTCNKTLIREDKLPTLNLPAGWRVGEAIQIGNKNEINETFTGIKLGHEIQTEVPIDQRFSYKLRIVPHSSSNIETNIETKEEGKLKIEIFNPSEGPFFYVERIELIPVLKERFVLTTLSSPKAIQLSRKSGRWGPYQFREPLDPNVYADIYNNNLTDAKPGRIMGITLADVSSYIARDIFYDKLSKIKKALIIVRSTDSSHDAERLKKGFEEIWTEELKNEFDSTVECYSYNDPELGCDTHSLEMRKAYNSSEVVFFANHGGTGGLAGIIYTCQLNYLSPSIQIADACLTCSFDDAYSKGRLFCVNNLRKGSLGYIGADSVSIGIVLGDGDKIIVAGTNRKFLPKLFEEDKSLGGAYIEIYPEGSAFYFVLGDPTFKVRP